MGTDIHCVLQKRNKETKQYETVLFDLFPYRDYNLFNFLSGVRGMPEEHESIAHTGLPEDFNVSQTDTDLDAWESPPIKHEGFYMGEYSFGHITLKEFCNAYVPYALNKERRYNIEQYRDGYSVTFVEDEEEPTNHEEMRRLQIAFDRIFDDTEDYRLVFGYD